MYAFNDCCISNAKIGSSLSASSASSSSRGADRSSGNSLNNNSRTVQLSSSACCINSRISCIQLASTRNHSVPIRINSRFSSTSFLNCSAEIVCPFIENCHLNVKISSKPATFLVETLLVVTRTRILDCFKSFSHAGSTTSKPSACNLARSSRKKERTSKSSSVTRIKISLLIVSMDRSSTICCCCCVISVANIRHFVGSASSIGKDCLRIAGVQ